jgi:CheY-like chemotaxis protein
MNKPFETPIPADLPGQCPPETILVVDDDPVNLEILCEIFERTEHNYVTATSGRAALELATSRGDIDVVLLDRMLPDMNGLEVLARLKSEFPQIMVVMQTAAATQDAIKEGIEAGVYYYLTKPFHPDVVTCLVRGALVQARETRNLQRHARRADELSAAFALISKAEFRFRTLEDARMLAHAAASGMPDAPLRMAALFELILNAIEHGNLGISYDTKTQLFRENRWADEIHRRLAHPTWADRWGHMVIERSPSCTIIHIADEGDGFDWRGYLKPDLSRAKDGHGFGITLARNGLDELRYAEKGNALTATIRHGRRSR